MSEGRVFHNLIGGEFVPAQSGKTFERRNPADTRDLVGVFADSDERDVYAAVEAAKAAFPHWSKVPAPKRGEILLRAAELLQSRKEQYSRDLTREMGKPLFEAGGDIVEAIGMAQYAGSEGRRMFGVTTPFRIAQQVSDEYSAANRCSWPDHAVELSNGYCILEDAARHRLWQHGCD
jgi:aldehyde dehydrogenase (NAD+)